MPARRTAPRPPSSAPRLRAVSPPAATAMSSPASTTSATRSRSRRSSRSTRARRQHRGWCSPTPAPTCTPLGRPLSTALPAAAPSTSPRARPTPQSGVLDYSFPALAGFTGSGTGATRTYTLATPTEPNGAKPVTARNQALLNSSATNFTLTSDAAAPTGGALTVNTVAASGAARRATTATAPSRSAPAPTTRDAASGLASSTLTRSRARSTPTPAPPTARRRRSSALRPERPCDRLLPLRPQRHRQRRQHRLDHHDRQGRHDRAGCSRPGARRLQRRRPHHRHHRLLPPAGSGSFDVTASSTDAQSGILDYSFPVLAGFTGSGAGCDSHLHAGDADRAERCQAGHGTQPGTAQLGRDQFHAHL